MLTSIAQTTPLNVIDQQFLPWDRLEPLCILCGLRVEGRLDRARLEDAVRRAASRHPMARARLDPGSWTQVRARWLIPAEMTTVPLGVAECVDHESLDAARSRLISKRLDLREGPPFALTLARHRGGDSLFMSFSHVAGDGIGAVRLMRSIICAYAGREDTILCSSPLNLRDLRFYNGGTSRFELVAEAMRIVERRTTRRPPVARATRLARVASNAEGSDGGEHGFCLLHLDGDETATAIARRQPGATVTDVLIAGLAIAVREWNRRHDAPFNQVRLQTAVNLRPSAWFTEVVSNFAREASVFVDDHEETFDEVQQAVAHQTELIRKRREAGEIPLVGPLSVVPGPWRYAVAKRLRQGAVAGYATGLSNLGRVDALPDLGTGAGRVTELWFAPPVTSTLGVLAGSLSFDREMFLSLHYLKSELTQSAAEEFAQIWRHVVTERV